MERQFDLQAANWSDPRAGHRFAVWAALWPGCCALAAPTLFFPALHIALLLAAYFPFSPAGLVALLRHRAYVPTPDYLIGIVICGLVLGLAHAWLRNRRGL
jgi:hypothetical protein